MVLKDLDKDIAKETGMTQVEIRKVIGSLEKVLLTKLVFGQEIVITRVGKFVQSKRAEREQHNVHTGKMETIPKHYKILFKTTPSLDARMKAKKVY